MSATSERVAWDAPLARVTKVEVYAGGAWQQRLPDGRLESHLTAEGPPILTLSAPPSVGELAELLAIDNVSDGFCMCLGDTTFLCRDFNGEEVALVALHHASHLRWIDWEGDALLRNGRKLVTWLAEQGYGDPLKYLPEDELRRKKSQRDQESWLSAMPNCLASYGERFVETSQRGYLPDSLIIDANETLNSSLPDPILRMQGILIWHSAGTGLCSGAPVHEDIPHQLLQRSPLVVILAALQDVGGARKLNTFGGEK